MYLYFLSQYFYHHWTDWNWPYGAPVTRSLPTRSHTALIHIFYLRKFMVTKQSNTGLMTDATCHLAKVNVLAYGSMEKMLRKKLRHWTRCFQKLEITDCEYILLTRNLQNRPIQMVFCNVSKNQTNPDLNKMLHWFCSILKSFLNSECLNTAEIIKLEKL